LSNNILAKINSAIFLTLLLITGTITSILPSFMIKETAQAEPYYDDMNYEKEYGYDKPYEKPKYLASYQPYYSKTRDGLDIKKLKCDNVNLNVNDASVNIGRPPIGNTTSLDTSSFETGDQEGKTTANNFVDSERYNNNEFKKDKDGFVYVCINNNNNNNEQAEETHLPPPSSCEVTVDTITGIFQQV
jgi:hypothetical protein